MAKGDHSRVQNAIDSNYETAQNKLNNLATDSTRQNQNFENHYNTAYDQNWQDYGNNTKTGNAQLANIYGTPVRNFGAYSGYQDFANTGGFTPDQINAIRQRSNSPIAAEYAAAKANLDRGKALTGGYMPNYAGALGRMTREQSINAGNQSMNTEAMLADQIRQGKLSGLSGMTNIDEALNNITNSRLGLGNQAYGNIVSNYSATPGQASMAGNQLNQSSALQNAIQEMQNQLSMGRVNAQLGESSVPGDFQQGMGNIGSVVGLASNVAGLGNTFGLNTNIFGGGGIPTANRAYLPQGPGY